MITEVSFKNYRALEDATLALKPMTLLVGPNGSGKTTVLQAMRLLSDQSEDFTNIVSVGAKSEDAVNVSFKFAAMPSATLKRSFTRNRSSDIAVKPHKISRRILIDKPVSDITVEPRTSQSIAISEQRRLAAGLRYYAFDAVRMRQAVTITAHRQLKEDGSNLAGFLDYIRDNGSDSFDALTGAIHQAAPEFDDIGFDGADDGQKTFKLRRTGTRSYIPARFLSEGTLYMVALRALAYQPELPTILCIEEPDRGIHPRLYRQIRDTLQRLAYPKDFGETRPAVQIIATTHSPYFLNEFTDHPEQVVVCEKDEWHRVQFRNLGDDPTARAILDDALIGDAWAAGALGGVPNSPLAA